MTRFADWLFLRSLAQYLPGWQVAALVLEAALHWETFRCVTRPMRQAGDVESPSWMLELMPPVGVLWSGSPLPCFLFFFLLLGCFLDHGDYWCLCIGCFFFFSLDVITFIGFGI